MTNSVVTEIPAKADTATPGFAKRLARFRVWRELLVIIAFCLFTVMLSWPYVTRLRDAVVDHGDPYLMSWVLWWDYHQTFTDPLHLFDANVFYPLRYTLAFTEHSYGLAVLFFPLFALGFKPLTVHAIAVFFAFALSGYAAFRLGRTLTGSAIVGWVAGIIFGFVPYRFHLMSQVMYLFSPWIPLLFEALVLFARQRSAKRAVWLGCTLFMCGLTTISWFTFALIPFALCASILATRYDLWRDRSFWWRGVAALAVAVLMLLPFMLPYVLVTRLYGFRRSVDEVKANSAWPIHWLSAEVRNKLWSRLGEGIPDGWKFKLFPGLLPILFSLTGLVGRGQTAGANDVAPASLDVRLSTRWLQLLDILTMILFALSIAAVGFDRTEAFHGLFIKFTSERVLTLLTIAVVVRLCIAYPRFLRSHHNNLIETIRSDHRSDAFWLGAVLSLIGFFYSLGWNFFLYRICYDLIPIFKSMRVPTRGAMFAYLGLALLSGLGVKGLSEVLEKRFPRLRSGVLGVIVCALMLAEFNAAPLRFARGDINPDAVTLRLKQTSMRGGIVVLPAGGDFNHRWILRAADHQKPLIVGTSGFNSPIEDRIEALTREGPIKTELMDLLDAVPASYLVIYNQKIVPERIAEYEAFLARAVTAGRLRFINRFDGHDDLYAVVGTEPAAKSEAQMPFAASARDWATKINEDPVNILSPPVGRSQFLYRIFLASSGAMPFYGDFIGNLKTLGTGIILGSDGEEQQFHRNLHGFAEVWVLRKEFAEKFGSLTDAEYVDRLLKNSGIVIDQTKQSELITELGNHQETRAGALIKIVSDPRFVEKENYRSLVLLHYFAYLRRNPGEPPDKDLSGFNFWVQDLARERNPDKLSLAFRDSIEYRRSKEQK